MTREEFRKEVTESLWRLGANPERPAVLAEIERLEALAEPDWLDLEALYILTES
jgi:hypothetical protein